MYGCTAVRSWRRWCHKYELWLFQQVYRRKLKNSKTEQSCASTPNGSMWEGWVPQPTHSAAQKTLVNIIFVTLKLTCVSNLFFHAKFKCVIRSAISPTVFVWKSFLKYNFSQLSFCLSCYQHILNMAQATYYILNIEWAWKFNHSKDSRHVSPIRDSQTVQAQTCTALLWTWY